MHRNNDPRFQRIPKDHVLGDYSEDPIKRAVRLSFAIIQKDYDTVNTILDMGVDLNIKARDIVGRTPFMFACLYHRPVILAQILTHPNLQFNCNIRDKLGLTALHLAIQSHNEFAIQELVEIPQVCINVRNKRGETPIWAASSQSDDRVVAILLSAQPDVNLPDDQSVTPLMRACALNSPEVVAMLIEAGADLNAVDSKNRSALIHGCIKGNAPCVTELLRHGAELDLSIEDNEDGLSAFEWATWKNQVEVVRAFLESEFCPSFLHPKYGRRAEEDFMGRVSSVFNVAQSRGSAGKRMAALLKGAVVREYVTLLVDLKLKPALTQDLLFIIAHFSC